MWTSTPEGKRPVEDVDKDSSVKIQRLDNATTIPNAKSIGEQLMKECPNEPRELRIGSCICTTNTKLFGTVSPFLKIQETGELCFLTVRHILGPFQSPERVIGSNVYLKASVEDVHEGTVCGQVKVAEYGESLDVALVKISEECLPPRLQFIQVVTKDCLYSQHNQLSSADRVVTDSREFTQDEIESHRLIKFGHSSGLTKGKFKLHDGKIKTGIHFIRLDEPNFMQILTYKDQYHVIPVESGPFATNAEVGAAVYLIDKNNFLSCVGIISRAMMKEEGVLVTPIQEILQALEGQLNRTLEVVPINPYLSKSHLDKDDHSLFSRALREGNEHDRHVRVNIIGFYAQGKTTLTRRLLNEPYYNIDTTDGIDVHIRRCKIKDKKWKRFDVSKESEEMSSRLVSVAKSVKNRHECKPIDISEGDDELDLTTELNEPDVRIVESAEKKSNESNLQDITESQANSSDAVISMKCVPLFRRFFGGFGRKQNNSRR